MVKVKNTEKFISSEGEHTVCKGKFLLIEVSDTADSLIFITSKMSGSKIWTTEGCGIRTPGTYYKPVIISETEKAEAGDFVYQTTISGLNRDSITQFTTRANDFLEGHYLKILVLPHQFSPKMLSDITDGKLKVGDEVFVDCTRTQFGQHTTDDYFIDFDDVYATNVFLKEDKTLEPNLTYTEKDILTIVKCFSNYMSGSFSDNDTYLIETLQKEDFSFLNKIVKGEFILPK